MGGGVHYITLHYSTLHYITLHYSWRVDAATTYALHGPGWARPRPSWGGDGLELWGRDFGDRDGAGDIGDWDWGLKLGLVFWGVAVHYITLHYITLHHITLHCITLHYIPLHLQLHAHYKLFTFAFSRHHITHALDVYMT